MPFSGGRRLRTGVVLVHKGQLDRFAACTFSAHAATRSRTCPSLDRRSLDRAHIPTQVIDDCESDSASECNQAPTHVYNIVRTNTSIRTQHSDDDTTRLVAYTATDCDETLLLNGCEDGGVILKLWGIAAVG